MHVLLIAFGLFHCFFPTVSSVQAQSLPAPQASSAYSLQDVVELAITNNPALQESQGILEQKEGQKRIASAYPNPTIAFQSGRGSLRDPSMGTTITERYITLSQPLEWPGKRDADQRAAQAGVESAQASFQEAQLDVIAATKHAFYNLLFATHQGNTATLNLESMKKVRNSVVRRIEAGEAPPFEGVKIQVELLKVKKERTQIQSMIHSLQAELNSLTAGALGNQFTIRGEFPSSRGEFLSTPLDENALAQHPVMQKWRKMVEEARQAHRREQQARMPNITLSGSYQRDVGREAYVGAISIPFPLWDQRQGNIAHAQGILRQREASLIRIKHQLLKNMIQQVHLSKSAAAQITTYEQGLLKQAQEALRIAQVSFKFGEANLMDVLDAQRVLRQTRLDYAQAQYDLAIALTELERLTGEPPPGPIPSHDRSTNPQG
ncbi:MAG: TolC family protein [Nitrospirota bacterium]|nr:TolC family protein [Nitrospirota bacterium]